MAMARWFEPTEEQVAGWKRWTASRPEAARAVLACIEPWELYLQPSTGLILTFHGLKTEAAENTFTVFTNIIGHIEHEFSSPYFGAPVADPGELEPYEPASPEEMMVLAHRASGEPEVPAAAH